VDRAQKLWWIRAVHTAIWFIFGTSILALPAAIFFNRLDVALGLALFVSIEVVALALNRMRCPLRDVAAHYTSDRSDGFDIFLPGWLAARTKIIFTPILIASVVWLGWRWMTG
jgi:hypothetical protein